MKPSESIKPVARIAKQRERVAASDLGKNMSDAKLQREQLDELISYREQYILNYQNACKQGMSSVQLREFQYFIERLELAIEQQQQQVSNTNRDFKLSQSQWQAMRNHSDMIEKLLKNKRYQERKHQQELEQKENDDRPVTRPRFPYS